MLLNVLRAKAESAGRVVVEVNLHYTSQRNSQDLWIGVSRDLLITTR